LGDVEVDVALVFSRFEIATFQITKLHVACMISIHDTPSGATFAIKVHPRARKNAVTGELGDALKVALTAPPLDGRANDACIEFFAKTLNVSRASVSIAAGQTSRNKVIRVAGLSAEEVRTRLDALRPE
jgi:uncharacterized protein (TIGR00251 family)